MGTTTPDAIFFPDSTTPWASTSDFSTNASSVQAALAARQGYTYRWPTGLERNNQTGMRQGDRGYEVDTHTDYIYDNSAWRVAVPYAEFTTATVTLASATTWATPSSISINSSTSTSTTFATTSGGTIVVADPGIYMVHVFSWNSAAGGTGFVCTAIASDYSTNFASQIGRGPFPSTDNVAQSVSYYRFPSANGTFYFAFRQGDTASRTYNATIRIARIG